MVIFPALVQAEESPRMLSTRQGEVIRLTLPASPDTLSIVGQFQGHTIPFFKTTSSEPAFYTAFIGVDLAQEVGQHPFYITFKNKNKPESDAIEYTIEVNATSFGLQTLTLPESKVDLDEKTALRVEKEAKQFKNTFSKITQIKLWASTFLAPVEGEISGAFGRRRIINGQEKNPHTGVDIAAPMGEEVMVSNHGKVVLTGDFFFNGNSIVIDHGGGLFTMYFHLSKINVKEGMQVKKGAVIGWVGQSGRATGPHLHWGANLNGARVDPFSLMKALE
jgi:murein DD-endopeptidase MepM/ murein hydrolase activator NlpD